MSGGAIDEQKFHWVVLFDEEGKLYNYTSRTMAYMTARIAESHENSKTKARPEGTWPVGVWALVDGEMVKMDLSFLGG